MTRKQWRTKSQAEDLKLILERYRRYLKDIGLRDSTIMGYISYLGRFLIFTGEPYPPLSKAHEYRDHLLARNLTRQTVNNACIAIKNYYKMQGEDFQFKFLDANTTLPFYFDQDDVLKIFSVASQNIKHLAMLKVLFYCSLRASEICGLEDRDVNLKAKVLRVRNGKGGKDGIVFLTEDCAITLKRYLAIRPLLVIDNKNPFFFTDYDNLWDRRDIYRMFIHYKKKAGITKPGGLHVFSRHTPATLMIKNGCDLRIVKDIMRHNDIATTLRYAHVADETRRAAYDKSMVL